MAVALFWRSWRRPVLTEKDTIVLGDFANFTGDPVFDGTLREGLSVQLEQSPFLSLVPEEGIQQTLRMMGQAKDVRRTPPSRVKFASGPTARQYWIVRLL